MSILALTRTKRHTANTNIPSKRIFESRSRILWGRKRLLNFIKTDTARYCHQYCLHTIGIISQHFFVLAIFLKAFNNSRPIQSNSPAIEPNRTPIVRLLNSIEHNRIHNKILPIEHNRTFDYRTIGIIERSINGRRIA